MNWPSKYEPLFYVPWDTCLVNSKNTHTMVIWVVEFQEEEINLARFSGKDRYSPRKLLHYENGHMGNYLGIPVVK